MKVYAPWTDEEVKALNKYQKSGVMHPFTCGDHSHFVLEAKTFGWICPVIGCYYEQDWCHDFMINVGKEVQKS